MTTYSQKINEKYAKYKEKQNKMKKTIENYI